jgi:hypothetical protein
MTRELSPHRGKTNAVYAQPAEQGGPREHWTDQALPVLGPATSQAMKPITGSKTTRTVQRTLRSVDALLWKILTIAQMSATRTRMPQRLLLP